MTVCLSRIPYSWNLITHILSSKNIIVLSVDLSLKCSFYLFTKFYIKAKTISDAERTVKCILRFNLLGLQPEKVRKFRTGLVASIFS